jgi:hypothetical protein
VWGITGICEYIDMDVLFAGKGDTNILSPTHILEDTHHFGPIRFTEFSNSCAPNRGKQNQYLGMSFEFRHEGKVKIRMTGYIEDLIEKMGVSHTASTPANKDLFSVNHLEPPLEDEGQKQVRSTVYQLLYVSFQRHCSP